MRTDYNDIAAKVAQKEYKHIGSGSGRSVYDLGNGYVAKVAKNIKGIAQNDAEYRISSDTGEGVFAKVVDVSDDFKYLIMEKAEPIRNMRFVHEHFNIKNNREFYKVKAIRDVLTKYRLKIGDFVRPSSWGLVNGVPVMVDFGLNDEVFDKYYFNERIKIFILLFLGMRK